MEDTIFGVFSGMYSDWKCHGYFPDAESAYRYCEMRNLTAKWDEFYVMPLQQIQCEFGKDEKKRFEFRLTLHERDGAYKAVYNFDEDPDVTYTDHTESKLCVNRYGVVFVHVVLEEYDPDLAVEVAEELADEYKWDIAEVLVDTSDGSEYRDMAIKTVWEGAAG